MLSDLIQISRRYGADSAFVLAGGGNTSYKTAGRLYVKASGHALSTIDATGFVELDRAKLDAMLARTWPSDPTQREADFIEAVMAARVHPELNQRPSVEALLHHLLPQPLVVHTHPGVVNALTCCVNGEQIAQQLFGDTALWQPYVDPGLTLAQHLQKLLRQRGNADVTLLQNHGLIVAGETAAAIEATSTRVVAAIQSKLAPPTLDSSINDKPALRRLAAMISSVAGEQVSYSASSIAAWIASPAGRAAALLGPLTPDQIVYCRSLPMVVPINVTVADFVASRSDYESKYGFEPWIALVESAGVLAFRSQSKMAETSLAVFLDAAAVYRDARRLGGVYALNGPQRGFIENWEVEAYRRAVAAK